MVDNCFSPFLVLKWSRLLFFLECYGSFFYGLFIFCFVTRVMVGNKEVNIGHFSLLFKSFFVGLTCESLGR